MQGEYLIIGSIVILVIVALIIIVQIIKKIRFTSYKNKAKNLEIQRNLVASTPVLLELSRVEPIIKNDKMEEKYNKWQDRFKKIKEERLSKIDDMLIDLDLYIDKKIINHVDIESLRLNLKYIRLGSLPNIFWMKLRI